MHSAIKNIILSNPPIAGEAKGIESVNTDVIVQFESGDEYVANVRSYNSLEKLLVDHGSSDEVSRKEHYQVLMNVVLVNDNAGGNLRNVIEHMVSEGDFQIAFRKL